MILIEGFSFRVVSHLGFAFKPCDGKAAYNHMDLNLADNSYFVFSISWMEIKFSFYGFS